MKTINDSQSEENTEKTRKDRIISTLGGFGYDRENDFLDFLFTVIEERWPRSS